MTGFIAVFSFYSILQCFFFFNLSFLKDLLTFYSLIPHFCALIFFTVFYNFYSYRTIHVGLYTHTNVPLCVWHLHCYEFVSPNISFHLTNIQCVLFAYQCTEQLVIQR